MLEYTVVALIVAIAVLIILRGVIRRLQGKSDCCSCMQKGACSMVDKCPPGGPGNTASDNNEK